MALLLASTPLSLSHSLKRERDEDEEVMALPMEHKKLRTLPFRTAPTSKPPSLFFSQTRPVSLPPALTTRDDSDDDSDDDLTSPSFRRPLSIPTGLAKYLDDDEDEVMQDSTQCISPAWSPKTTLPPMLPNRPARLRSLSQVSNASSADISRIPTPIYSQFGSLSFNPVEGSVVSSMPGFSPNKMRARSSVVDDEAKYALYLHRRRLPSPISEVAMDSPSSSRTTPTLGSFSQSQEADDGLRGTCTPPTPVSGVFAKGVAWERGRKRSDAISGGVGCGLVSGTVEFSMGFRMGCERCKERVPGHYNHVLRGC